jgi:exonuclease III
LWSISNFNGLNVHCITVYIPPTDQEACDYFVRLIRFTLKELIFKRDMQAKVIVMGDFNLIGMKKVDFMTNLGLTASIPPNQATHRLNNQLD